jgi:probable HAF family extracellular repeat protein
MNFRGVTLSFAGLSFLTLGAGAQVQQNLTPLTHSTALVRYRVVDLGTLGGPQSQLYGGNSSPLNTSGAAVGQADTSAQDPEYPRNNPYVSPNGPSAYLHQAFLRTGNRIKSLGSIGGGNNSAANWVSQTGLIAGVSENGVTDPHNGWPEGEAVLWKNGKVTALGTLGGSESAAAAVNDLGEVVGYAANTTRDPFTSPMFRPGYGTQQRAFLWKNGRMQDLGTLGGPDAAAMFINDLGQVAGVSYTSNFPAPLTEVPPVDPFFWQNGKMVDIGSLGGTVGSPNWMNSVGQVVGVSDLKGDLVSHPFLWSAGKLTDLGTLGGSYGTANSINDLGIVVGAANTTGNRASVAFLWNAGKMSNLGTLSGDQCSSAYSVNVWSQVVGSSGSCYGAMTNGFLWENGRMVALDSFLPAGSGVHLMQPVWINDLSQIAVNGTDANGDLHAFLLVPQAGITLPRLLP